MSGEGEINEVEGNVPGTFSQEDGRGSFSSFEKLSVNDSSRRESPDPQATQGPPEGPEDGPAVGQAHSQEGDHPPNAASSQSTLGNPVGGMKELKELEEAATKAAVATRGAAIKFANEAKAFMSSIWSAFDDPEAMSSGAVTSDEQLAERLGLEPKEAILESFRCKLIQRYQSLNGLTPPKNIAFSGQLHIAAHHIVFELDNSSQMAADNSVGNNIRLDRQELKAVKRDGDVLHLEVKDGKDIIFGAFSFPKLEVESALALLEAGLASKQQQQQ